MKIITFGIAKGGTGKTLITANVALALANRNKKVLLIDCDIGSKSLTYIFDVKPKYTLSEVINKKENIKKAIYPTKYNNIDIILMGESLDDYVNLNIDLVDEMSKLDYDYILIDAPATSTGIETYISLGLSDYFIPVIDYNALSPSLQGAINTLIIGKNYLECNPAGFIINNAGNIPESIIKDIEKILGVECIVTIPKLLVLEQAYEKKIIPYKYSRDFGKLIDKIADKLEELEDIKKRGLPEVLKKINENILF
ncbi:ParA family protein [Methanocaldococcus indicus]|uniref:ParA family protein n=1 Tax=Methanocaldococcus indicus TaxID=213231 RepID=UPI003C6D007E